MSGGGAGKVYFVLYLAVVLELLIIIVERDEAEEHLHAKQKETMKIVQSILSQLQAGSGTEGINTRPQDEITIPPSGIDFKEVMGTDIKTSRKYVIEVGVTDVASDLKKKEGETPDEFNERLHKLIRLANVQELEYQIFFNPSKDPLNPPTFPSEKYFDENNIEVMKMNPGDKMETTNGEVWTFKGAKKLVMDIEPTFNKVNKDKLKSDPLDPVYKAPIIVGEKFVPSEIKEDSTFYFSSNRVIDADGKSVVKNGKEDSKLKRAFVVYFEPPAEEGWYKLRFYSKTNRILGIAADAKAEELTDNMTVNIGTVQLKVKDLQKVSKELEIELDKFKLPKQSDLLASADGSDNFDDMIEASKKLAEDELDYIQVSTKIELYGYIIRLLTPGKSVYFPQNSNSIEFDIRVLTPQPKIADAVIAMADEINYFDALPPTFKMSLSPYQGDQTINKLNITAESASGEVYTKSDFDIQLEKSYRDKTLKVGEQVEYVIKFKNNLPPVNGDVKSYDLTVEYNSGNSEQSKSYKKGRLNLFKTKDDENIKTLQGRIFFYSGEPFRYNFTPTSGGKIPASQFRSYIHLDGSQKIDSIVGLNTEKAEWLLHCNNKSYDYWVNWIDPVTNKKIEVFPRKTYEIPLEKPYIDVSGMSISNPIGEKSFTINIKGITALAPSVFDSKNCSLILSADEEVVIVNNSPTLKNIKASISLEGEEIQLKLRTTGTPVKGIIQGDITLRIKIIARQSDGLISVSEEEIFVPIYKKIENKNQLGF